MQIKRHMIVWPLLLLAFGLLLLLCTPAHAITEDEVLAQVDAAGKEAVAGNVLVWFLCAVAFLKVSQKIDSFMASIGVNVGHTGGSMLSDVLIVTRALSAAVGAAGRSFGGKGGSSSGSSGGARAGERTSGGPFQGGLAGIVSRAVNNSAIKTATENKAYSGSVQSDMAREAVNAASSGKVNAATNASSSVSSSTHSTSQQSASAQSAPSAANQQSTIHGSGFSADASGDMPVGAASVASDSISINEAEDESEAHPIPQSDPGISISAAPNEATDTPETEKVSPAVPAASMAGGIRTSHSESEATSTSSNVVGSSVPIPQQNADGSPNTVSSGEGSFTPVTAGAGVSETVQQAVSASTEQPPISVPADAPTVVTDGPNGSEGGSAGSPVTPIPGGAQGIVSESTKQSESVVSEHAADGKSSAPSGAGLHGGERTESVTIPVTNNPTNTIKAQGSGTPGSRPAAAGGSEAVVSKSSQATHTSSAQSSVRTERVHGYGIGGAMFMRSLASGGSFANNIIGKVATGSVQNTGSISGDMASQVLTSYMGFTAIGSPPESTPKFTDVEIGGGRITGIETAPGGGQSIQFAMYHTNQYEAPRGDFTKVVSADGETWYKQYAQDTVERTPYKAPDNSVAYNETIVQRMPEPPRRKDKN